MSRVMRPQTVGTPKLVVCSCFSSSKGVFSGSMLVFGGVHEDGTKIETQWPKSNKGAP